MKLLLSTVAANIFVSAQTTRVRTKFIEEPYAMNLNCGDCIAAGHNFLWRSEVNGLVVNDEEYPTNTGKYDDTDIMCCEGSFAMYDKTYDYTKTSPEIECAKLFKRANNRDKKVWR